MLPASQTPALAHSLRIYPSYTQSLPLLVSLPQPPNGVGTSHSRRPQRHREFQVGCPLRKHSHSLSQHSLQYLLSYSPLVVILHSPTGVETPCSDIEQPDNQKPSPQIGQRLPALPETMLASRSPGRPSDVLHSLGVPPTVSPIPKSQP